MSFDAYIGIDYSGRGEPDRRVPGIQIAIAEAQGPIRRVYADALPRTNGWSRREAYEWLRDLLKHRERTCLIGLDHCFSFPRSYFALRGLEDWDAFLRDFRSRWNTMEEPVRSCLGRAPAYPNSHELRRTEMYTGSAKSAWNFEQMTGAVSYSTHAGLPWIYELRREFRETLHVWPFDGWQPREGKSVLAEVYPSLLYRRYERDDPDFPRDWPRDAQDAYVVAAWLRDRERNGTLERYFSADTLTAEEKRFAARCEGWILGVC